MFGRFFYGQCSLAEAFWKFSFLGLAVSGFVTRLLMIFLKQSAGYETRYLQVLWNNISLLSMLLLPGCAFIPQHFWPY